MGRYAVDLLVERIDQPDAPPRHHLLAPPISLRASTGPGTGTPSTEAR
jgi:DNA-binding LacI/PurR family transcriptional regulator